MKRTQAGYAHRAGRGRVNARGFTLIELVITVAIVAILATIALASYEFAVTKSRRAAAATCLQERAQFAERFYTTNMTYLGLPDPEECQDLDNFYDVSLVAAATATAYQMQAVPIGSQLANDTKCGTLAINQQGVRSEGGSAATADECW